MTHHLSRRGLIATTSGVVAVPVLNACGTDDGTAQAPTAPPEGGTVLVSTADVPVGGCAVNADEKVVVTQPSEGEFKAYSAVCTHQGCLVDSSSAGDIPCKCHGSRFSLADGTVLQGPAEAALAQVTVTVVDGAVQTA